MSKLVWDQTGERLYKTGTSHGALFVQNTDGSYENGVAWNGLTGVTESPSGAELTALYADDIKYLNLMSAEELGITIEAYMYPDEFMECDGTAKLAKGVFINMQTRKRFALVYRTILGNDTESNDYGYKIHIIYGLTASPSEKGYSTVNDSPEAITFSWECESTPVELSGYDPVASITIDSTKISAAKLKEIEDMLWGEDYSSDVLLDSDGENILDSDGEEIGTQDLGNEATLLMPSEILTLAK